MGLPGWTRTTDLGIAAAVIHLQSPALPTELPRGDHVNSNSVVLGGIPALATPTEQKEFPDRELNPGLTGESRVS